MATSKPRLDRRIVRSRNAILSAFERLLKVKPLADITVSAIAREANVDRKTFYVHFGTVDGLLDAIAVDVVEMIVDSVEKTLASMDGDTNERALGEAATFFKTVNEALCNNLVLNRQLIERTFRSMILWLVFVRRSSTRLPNAICCPKVSRTRCSTTIWRFCCRVLSVSIARGRCLTARFLSSASRRVPMTSHSTACRAWNLASNSIDNSTT